MIYLIRVIRENQLNWNEIMDLSIHLIFILIRIAHFVIKDKHWLYSYIRCEQRLETNKNLAGLYSH